MKSKKPLCPVSPAANRSLKLKLIRLKEDFLMGASRKWRFALTERRQNRIAYTDRLRAFDQARRQVAL
jgi:hypothetical protein